MRTASWLILPLAVASAACGNGPNDDGPIFYEFSLQAFGADTTPERRREFDCLLFGSFNVPRPLEANGTVSFTLRAERHLFEARGTHFEQTRAETTFTDAELAYTGLGGNSLSFMLTAGDYNVSLGPGDFDSSWPAYFGEWTCEPAVPLGQDSTLLAYGYDAGLQLPGRWRVAELLPFD